MKMSKRILTFIATIMLTVVNAEMSTASTLFFYEPKKPNEEVK